MKITVEISEKDLKEVMRLSGTKKKGPAIQKFVTDGLMMRRRQELCQKVMTGEIRIEFPEAERVKALNRGSSWNK